MDCFKLFFYIIAQGIHLISFGVLWELKNNVSSCFFIALKNFRFPQQRTGSDLVEVILCQANSVICRTLVPPTSSSPLRCCRTITLCRVVAAKLWVHYRGFCENIWIAIINRDPIYGSYASLNRDPNQGGMKQLEAATPDASVSSSCFMPAAPYSPDRLQS
jgi:hypothetical protein